MSQQKEMTDLEQFQHSFLDAIEHNTEVTPKIFAGNNEKITLEPLHLKKEEKDPNIVTLSPHSSKDDPTFSSAYVINEWVPFDISVTVEPLEVESRTDLLSQTIEEINQSLVDSFTLSTTTVGGSGTVTTSTLNDAIHWTDCGTVAASPILSADPVTIFGEGGKMVVTIKRDGNVEIGEGVELDEVSHDFWKRIKEMSSDDAFIQSVWRNEIKEVRAALLVPEGVNTVDWARNLMKELVSLKEYMNIPDRAKVPYAQMKMAEQCSADEADLEYFQQKFFTSLRVPARMMKSEQKQPAVSEEDAYDRAMKVVE